MTSTETYYPHLRDALDDGFGRLSDAELDAAFEEAFGQGVTPAEYEEFFGAIGKALKKAAPTLAAIGQGALTGAATGSIAGPFGALGGAVLGGVGSALAKHGKGGTKGLGQGLSGVVNTAGMLTGRGMLAQGGANVLGLVGKGSGPATNALRMVLQRPETGAALSALFSGKNAAIPIGRTGPTIPASAFAGLLAALARDAEAETIESGDAETIPGYLFDPAGKLVVDPTDPDLRSARVLQLLATVPADPRALRVTDSDEYDAEGDTDDDFALDYDDTADAADLDDVVPDDLIDADFDDEWSDVDEFALSTGRQ